MAKHQEAAQLLEHEAVAHQTYRMKLHSPTIAGDAQAGQFLMLQVRDGNDPLLRRPFSFHRIQREQGAVEILYRVVGRGTWLMSQMEPGSTISLLGPLGNGFDLTPSGAGPVFLAAGGIGIAPLKELTARLLAGSSRNAGEDIHLFYGARTAAELLDAGYLAAPGLRIHWSTDDGTVGFRGYVTQVIEQVVRDEGVRPTRLYACGPLAMQYRLGLWALREGVDTQLSLESLMACGFGACLGCALPAANHDHPSSDHYLHVCKDGPIFSAGSIQWDRIRQQQIAPPIFRCI
jgi:dihydroorotate dehydrogenase electron transfer subunit